MAVAFEELEGSPTISIGADGTRATRIFRVAWADWPAMVRALLGAYQRVGSQFRFVAPLEFPGLPGVVVAEIDVAPFDPGNPDGGEVSSLAAGTNRYPAAGAQVTARYESLPAADAQRGDLPPVPNGTYLTYRADLGAEFFTVPGRGWHWDATDDPPLPADINPGIVIPTGLFRLTWHRVASPPWEAMRALRGKVNADEFLGAAAGTVLFLGARAVRQFEYFDGGFWRVEYLFSERAIELEGEGVAGWNHMHREEAVEGENWVKVLDANDQPPYSGGDLMGLFQFA